ncbi:electron transfer flavoprotein subunit alpha/FixB family protein [Pseudomonas taiwanensis]|uniref:electron transfer flavoprotein subunit alpha/FixB family protein n=1 Tax=Pseudomonas taiwanensis TaxID=470150 RepID=UPI0016476536|nr:electron transfer flavoprotein subunit alpha/FixB family protein [Pseudomonas taiwanensis]MBC3492457.1 electron transfer flavoprotein subunit alpha/FixB family protein [Pseudomonas taiwanensis]
MTILVFGEIQSGELVQASAEAVTAALGVRTAGVEIVGALMGSGASSIGFNAVGLDRTVVVDDPRLGDYLCETHVSAAAEIAKKVGAELIIVPHTSNSLEWAPRLAARLNAAIVTNGTLLERAGDSVLVTKPVGGGAVQAQYAVRAELKVVTLSAGAFAAAAEGSAPAAEQVALGEVATPVELVETISEAATDGPSLRTAKVVVSGGIGIGGVENWKVIEDSAKGLGAAVGATRAAVEMGWVPTSKQVGFSGLKVAADLYVAAGISGAIHHLAGISRVKNVVAINNDAEANIFSVANYGVVGDAKAVLPAFVARVNELRGK